jgi:hypothetical protein
VSDNTTRDDNPYVGPRAFRFEERDRFFGRERVGRELLTELLTERVVLLHSSSGAGKSSLIQAKLKPGLVAEGFRLHNVIRVNAELPAGWARRTTPVNRYVYSALLHLEGSAVDGVGVESQPPAPALALESVSLADYLNAKRRLPDAPRAPDGTLKPEVLIFDQFEEVLTVDQFDREAKREFFRQVGEALMDRNRWALFAMREEHVAALDTYAHLLRLPLTNRYCLGLLEVEDAKEAIEGPARVGVKKEESNGGGTKSRQVSYDEKALALLVGNLRTVKGASPAQDHEDDVVEPVHLQVVCSMLWDNLEPTATKVTLDDVQRVGDVDKALGIYYARQVKAAADSTGVAEVKIRDWIGSKLITGNIRTQVLRGSEADFGLTPETVAYLDRKFIVRLEHRRNGAWYELAHDRLILPVCQDNDRWFFEQGIGDLHRQAERWIHEGRPPHLLLSGAAWNAARETVRDRQQSVTPALRDYYQASKERMKNRRNLRNLAIVGTLAGALAVTVVALVVMLSRYEKQSRTLGEEQLALKRWRDSVETVLPLLREKDWGLQQSSSKDKGLLQLSLRADSLIRRQLDVTSTSVPDTVVYFLKQGDPAGASTSLHELGFPVNVQPAISSAVATNAIAFASNADVEHVKIVALTLIRAGVALRMICQETRGKYPSHAIQVYSNPRGATKPVILLDQVTAMSPSRRSINCDNAITRSSNVG